MTTQTYYHIRIRGRLDPKWADWFDCITVTAAGNGESTLTGPIVDQAALFGVLDKIRDLGLELISVNRAEPDADKKEIHET